jgi:translation initiation factor 2B subunit (eIF-2B alpha/beta/delta family)
MTTTRLLSKLTFYTTRVAIERNVTQVHTLIRNHSSVLGEHARLLEDAAQSRSSLLRRIDETSNSVTSLGALVSEIRSNVTLIQSSVTGLRGTLTTNVNNLNTRIDDHVDWIQHSLADQSRRLTNFESRIRAVEASDAVRVMPLGFLLLKAITLFVCYVVMF